MRILSISESFPTSTKIDLIDGVGTRDWYVATELARRHDVTVITPAKINHPPTETIKRVKIIRLGIPTSTGNNTPLIARLKFFEACKRVIPQMHFDLIQGSNFFTQHIIADTSRSFNQPTVALMPTASAGFWIKHPLEKWVMMQPWDKIISWSESVTQTLIRQKVDPHSISIIPGGVDNQLINSQYIPKRKTPTVVTVIQRGPHQQTDLLIKAIALLVKKYPQLKLYILGDGPDRKMLEQVAIDSNCDNRVFFLGQVGNYAKVIKLIKSAHIFSLASHNEESTVTILAACACGLPYIIEDSPTTRQVTENGQGGFLIDQPTQQHFADTLDELLKNHTLYNTKVHQGRALARKNDWSVCARKTEKIYHTLIRQTSKNSLHY